MSACPKCKFQLDEGALECPACGIVIAKYLALGTGPVPTVPESPASPAPASDPPPEGTTVPASGSPGEPIPTLAEEPSIGFAPEPEPPPPALAESEDAASAVTAAPFRGNPYAPPVAGVAPSASAPGEVFGSVDGVTQLTVHSLEKARPWMKFLVIYGWVMMIFIILGAVGVLFAAPGGGGEALGFFLVYFCYALIGFSLLLPLARSANALKGIGTHKTSDAVEGFAVHQAAFWRRSGIVALVGLILLGFLLLLVFVGVGASLISS